MRISVATSGASGNGVSQSTPNSPRLMPRRVQRPPPIPAKPSAASLQSASGSGNVAMAKKHVSASGSDAAEKSDSGATQSVTGATINPGLAALDTDAPWPHFSTLTEHLDVHQVNNYAQPVPEVSF